jgi:hypothetical protein
MTQQSLERKPEVALSDWEKTKPNTPGTAP